MAGKWKFCKGHAETPPSERERIANMLTRAGYPGAAYLVMNERAAPVAPPRGADK